ncbi:alpha/beta hydrolase family esterase [Zhouia sp. PK063]|uniref:alpha/beta hydrolase family esterase n=1 Tax=Zhouia sp. PK063 TaxID=3373602 RepID=UPI0037AA7878
MKPILFFLVITFFGFFESQAQQDDITIRKWEVNGVSREAMVYVPKTALNQSTPVLFVFHGHGETMQQMFERYHFESLWPEALIIAPQGLNTPGQLVDKQGNYSGWQKEPGAEGDRDLHFFDMILDSLYHDYKVDKSQIFVTGHSNGGSFTYILWAERSDVLAGVAPSAAVVNKVSNLLKPKPVMHIMGESDRLVKPLWQRMTCNILKKINHCTSKGVRLSKYATLYPSNSQTPVVVFAHPRGHVYPQDACVAVVNFFKKIGKHNF